MPHNQVRKQIIGFLCQIDCESEEEKLKFYTTSCSFWLCNSACSLQSQDRVGPIVSESGDLEY